MNKIVKMYSELSVEELAVILVRQSKTNKRISNLYTKLTNEDGVKNRKRLKNINKVQEDLGGEVDCIGLGVEFKMEKQGKSMKRFDVIQVHE